MNKKVEEMSVVELKSMGYDLIVSAEQVQNNLRIINAELAKRNQPQVEPAKEEVKSEVEVLKEE